MGTVLFVLHRSVGLVPLFLIKPRRSLLGVKPDAAAAPFPYLTLRGLQESGSQVLCPPEGLPHRNPPHQILARLPSLKNPAGTRGNPILIKNQMQGPAIDPVKFLLKVLFLYKKPPAGSAWPLPAGYDILGFPFSFPPSGLYLFSR